MGIRSSMARDALLLTLANLAMRAVAMLFQVYLTGQVGAAGVGLLQLILTVHAFAMTIGTSGIRVAAMYLTAEEYGLNRPHGVRQALLWCMSSGTVLSAAVGGMLFLGSEPLALYWVKDLQACASLRLLGLTLPLNCLSAILAGYFTACGQVKRLVVVEIGDRVATIGLTMWLLKLGVPGDLSHACVAIVGGGALASLGSVAVLLVLAWRDLRQASGPSLSMGSRLVRFCIPVALNDYLRSGLGTLEQFLIPHGLARCGGSRTRAMADYGTIQGMVFPVLLLPNTVLFALADLLIPRLARYRARKDRAGTQRIASSCLRLSTLFSLAVAGLLFVLAESLGSLLYQSADASRYLRLFAPLIPVLYLDCIVDGMHKGLGEQIYCVRVNTLTNLMDVVLLFLLLPRWGVGGYYVTYVLTHVINFLFSLHRLVKLTRPRVSLRFLLAAAGSTAAAAGLVFLWVPTASRWSSVLVSGGLYLTTLLLLLILTGVIDKPEADA